MSTVPASAAVPRPSRPVFTLRQASSSDAATLSLIRSLAFGSPSDPIQRQVWPFSVSSFDSYVSYVEEVMKWEMRDHQRRGGSGEWWVVETDQGEAAATGQWEVFDRNPHKGIGEGEPEPKHSDTNEALFQDYFGRQDVAHKEIMGSQPHICPSLPLPSLGRLLMFCLLRRPDPHHPPQIPAPRRHFPPTLPPDFTRRHPPSAHLPLRIARGETAVRTIRVRQGQGIRVQAGGWVGRSV